MTGSVHGDGVDNQAVLKISQLSNFQHDNKLVENIEAMGGNRARDRNSLYLVNTLVMNISVLNFTHTLVLALSFLLTYIVTSNILNGIIFNTRRSCYLMKLKCIE